MNFTPNFIRTKDEFVGLIDQPTIETVSSYMVPASKLITFKPNQRIYEVIFIMIDKKISGAPVLDNNGKIVGILSEKDCLEIIMDVVYNQHEQPKALVRDYMNTDVTTISADTTILDVAERFIYKFNRRYPVVNDEGQLVGQISRRDVLQAALDMRQ